MDPPPGATGGWGWGNHLHSSCSPLVGTSHLIAAIAPPPPRAPGEQRVCLRRTRPGPSFWVSGVFAQSPPGGRHFERQLVEALYKTTKFTPAIQHWGGPARTPRGGIWRSAEELSGISGGTRRPSPNFSNTVHSSADKWRQFLQRRSSKLQKHLPRGPCHVRVAVQSLKRVGINKKYSGIHWLKLK